MTGNPTPIRVGVLRLTDAAPVFVALEQGAFAAAGIDFQLSLEPSWANIADKLSYHALDAAVILPPLAFAVTLGLRGGASTPMLIPASLSRNGNPFTMATGIADAIGSGFSSTETGRQFVAYVREQRGEHRLRFAVVQLFSSHNLLFRDWIASAGGDPDADLDIVVIPPADMVAALESGYIAGFCSGAPWGAVATQKGIGRNILNSSDIWPNHPEKCFAVSSDFAGNHPQVLQRILRVLASSGAYCDDPAHGDEIARLLARPDRIGVDATTIRSALPGADGGQGAERILFSAAEAGLPAVADGLWFLEQMKRWGYVPSGLDLEKVANSVYRPDLWLERDEIRLNQPNL